MVNTWDAVNGDGASGDASGGPKVGRILPLFSAGWLLLGESSTTAAPILETLDFRLENLRSAEVGYSGLDIQVKPAFGYRRDSSQKSGPLY